MLESKTASKVNLLIDFFLPRFCLCCDVKLHFTEKVVCTNCRSQLLPVDRDRLQFEFNKKFATDKIIDSLISCYLFQVEGNIQILMHELKYKNKFGVGSWLGEQIADKLVSNIESSKFDLIIPMPLHNLKKAERGFNQAFFISKGISKKLKIPVNSSSVKRYRFTQSQTKLNIEERRKNVEGAFKVMKPEQIKNKNILLVDDVITTGASVSEVGKLLKKVRAKSVTACSVALAD